MSEQQVTNEPQSICANCQQRGTQLCKCKQVFYCGDECKVKHRQHHQVICDSDMLSDKWRPIWEIEERPSRLNDTGKREDVATKYLWGNVPAIDVLKLKENEGDSYNEPLSIMFAASGDIRHIVKTIAELPTGYEGDPTLYINDQETDVVARNVLLLIMMFGIEDKGEDVIDTILHVWYPAFITPKHRQFLTSDVQTFLTGIAENAVPWQDGNGKRAERFTTSRLFNLNFSNKVWDKLMSFFDSTKFQSRGEAARLRRHQVYARRAGIQRAVFEDAKTLLIYPSQRPGWLQFRDDGILLPLGHSREEYKVTNPTLFTSKDWLLKCQSDPNDGWNIADVLRPDSANSEDGFGKLYRYVKDVLRRCRNRLSSLNCKIHMLSSEATELTKWAAGKGLTFDRIESSNIADHLYVGIDETVQHLSRLLKGAEMNKFATLLTLSMKITDEVDSYLALVDPEARHALWAEAESTVGPLLATRPGLVDKEKLLGWRGVWSMWEPNQTLAWYKEHHNFDRIEQTYNVSVKKLNTITQRFVFMINNEQIGNDAQLQFWNFLSSYLHRPKCYLEWKKKDSPKRQREDGEDGELGGDEEDREKKRRKAEDVP